MEYFTAKSNAFGGKGEVFTSIAIAEAKILGVKESQQMVFLLVFVLTRSLKMKLRYFCLAAPYFETVTNVF